MLSEVVLALSPAQKIVCTWRYVWEDTPSGDIGSEWDTIYIHTMYMYMYLGAQEIEQKIIHFLASYNICTLL